MGKLKNNQTGFSAVEAVMLVVIVALNRYSRLDGLQKP